MPNIYSAREVKKVILASDAFGRANENPLAGNWKYDAAQTLSFQLTSNKVGGVTSSGHCATYYDGGVTWPSDQWSRAVVDTISDGDIGVCVRINPANGARYWYEHRTVANGGLAISFRDSAGTVNPLCQRTDLGGQAGDVIEIWAIGSMLYAYVNDFLILAYDTASSGGGTSQFTGGSPGMWRYNTSSLLTNWQAGGFGLSDADPRLYRPK